MVVRGEPALSEKNGSPAILAGRSAFYRYLASSRDNADPFEPQGTGETPVLPFYQFAG